jgi:hypothetical protein
MSENVQTDKKLNLYQKIQAVSIEINNISKNMQVGNANYGYKAVSELDVVLAVKKAEKKFGLVSIPLKQELVKSEVIKVLKEKGGESINYVDIVKMTLRIIDLDNTDSFIDIESFGRGLDSGDKGFGKASTYARKYALLNAYKIATGEDPENDKSKAQMSAEPNVRRNTVINYMLTDHEYLLNILTHFGIGTIDEMDEKQVEIIYSNLIKKGKLK